jgi:HTH-type transcriptional regulator/antitoxin HigA
MTNLNPNASGSNDLINYVTQIIPDNSFADAPAVAASPGFYLRLVLEQLKLSQAQLASRTGLSTKHINQVVQGLVPISPETAILLERSLGVPSRTWNFLEATHQDARARERSMQQLSEYVAWLKNFPTKELVSRGKIDASVTAPEQVGQLLSFFRVANPDAYDRVWSGPVASGFRRSEHHSINPYATAVWLRCAELEAQNIDVQKYDHERFADLLPQLRSLTLIESDKEAFGRLQQLCADVGVAVAYVPEVKGSRASGVARWIHPGTPMIALSGRYSYADGFWFSFFHEAAHVLLHAKREMYIHADLKTDDADGLEGEANRAAVRYLVGPELAKKLHSGLKYAEVEKLADDLDVHVGIVAAQLSRAIGDYAKYSRLRKKISLSGSAE